MRSQRPRRLSRFFPFLSLLSSDLASERQLFEGLESLGKIFAWQVPASPFREALPIFPSPLPKPEVIPR
jgi:hypothetical protein